MAYLGNFRVLRTSTRTTFIKSTYYGLAVHFLKVTCTSIHLEVQKTRKSYLKKRTGVSSIFVKNGTLLRKKNWASAPSVVWFYYYIYIMHLS